MGALKKSLIGLGVGIGAWYLGKSIVRHGRQFALKGKVAIVTGGSRGLGLVIARQLVQAGANVAICARTALDVTTALQELQTLGGDVFGTPCDVRDESAVDSFVESVVARWGRVDLLFNVAGVMEVGPLDAMTTADFRESMEINCWGPLNTTLAVLPIMRQHAWGRIVNIASIGGKQSVPHMLPYSASKHALVGLSNGLRAELAKDGILVTTACPTLMRTGSPRNATFKGRHREEYAWFSLGGSLPIVSMDCQKAASQILEACRNGDGEIYISNLLNPPSWAVRCAPNLTAEVLMIIDRMLPKMGGIGQQAAYGYQSESSVSPSLLTTLSQQSEIRNNESGERPTQAPHLISADVI